MVDDPREPGEENTDNFGWGQQPLRRTDETTGDEGIEPPVGQGHDEATIGQPDGPDEIDRDDVEEQVPDRDDVEEQVPGYPTAPRGPDSQE